MITFYTYPGPNGRKVSIMLEEATVSYQIEQVDIGKGEQFQPEFLKISPNNKIPAIVDHDTKDGVVAVFETGAILIYLAEKTGRFLATSPHQRAVTLAWLVWGLTGLGATLPQLHHFGDRPDTTAPEVIDRFATEAVRLYTVLERRLSDFEFVAGDYSIADMATYASAVGMLATVRKWKNSDLGATPSIDRWMRAIGGRPAVQKGMSIT